MSYQISLSLTYTGTHACTHTNTKQKQQQNTNNYNKNPNQSGAIVEGLPSLLSDGSLGFELTVLSREVGMAQKSDVRFKGADPLTSLLDDLSGLFFLHR